MPYGTLNADVMTTSDGVSSSGLYGFKNRIINGAMVIDQRNAGASVTPTTTANGFPVDRFLVTVTQNSKLTTRQSTTAAIGFTNSLLITSSSAYSITSSDVFVIRQSIEGFNFCDLGFGTASAATVTLSFWVRSSLTGTFGGSLTNYAATRSYPFTYTISVANTWEQKTVNITGDTSGTWVGASNAGTASLWFGLGVGSTSSGTAGAWAAADYRSATGATSVVGTNGATFYITGVQLEKGSTATSFDYRPYGTELMLCQRYFYNLVAAAGSAASTTKMELYYQHPVPMRAAPTLNIVGLMKIEDVSVGFLNQSSATSTLEQASYLGMKPGFGNFSGLTTNRPYYIAATAANITASPPTNLCQVSAEL